VASATRKRKNIELPVAQFIAVIVFSISVFLIIDFGRRAATGYRVYREEKRLEAQLEAAKQTREILLARKEYVKTDTYIEEVARNELKWSKPGETVIVVMTTPGIVSSSPASTNRLVLNDSVDNTPLHAWLILFFPELEK
jgi:cell division protein FtsB